MVIEDRAIR